MMKPYLSAMKTLVITGGTKGMGRAIAERFAQGGFAIAFCARREADVNEFASYLKDKYSVEVLPFVCDVEQKSQLQAFADAVAWRFDQADILVNNAGTFLPGSITAEKEGAFEKQMAINVAAPYYFTRMVFPMVQKAKGHIFTICSVGSIMPIATAGSYCISKHAVYGMTRALREETKGKGVKVTAIIPGSTYTSSWEGSDVDPTRLIPAEDIAGAIWAAYNTAPSTVMEEIIIRPHSGEI